MTRFFLLFCALVSLSGCYKVSRLSEVGSPPRLTPTQDPTAHSLYKRVTMPTPERPREVYPPNSLWRSGAKGFFKDQRASKVGDLIMVLIEIQDKAEFKNETKQESTRSHTGYLNNLLGLEKKLFRAADQASPTNLISAGSKPSSDGKSIGKRHESMNLKLAAVVTQILPNGNLVVMGRQEVRMNFDVRDVLVSGVVRPADITAENTISYEQIGEARLSYGGRGYGSDIQQPSYGQEIMTQILPF